MNRLALRIAIAIGVIPLAIAAGVATLFGILYALDFLGATQTGLFEVLNPHGLGSWFALAVAVIYWVIGYCLIARKALPRKAVHV